jgi:hypothetical protein
MNTATESHTDFYHWDDVAQCFVYDSFGFLRMIPIGGAAFWKNVLEEITWSMAAYSEPKVREVVLIRQDNYTFTDHTTEVSVRYMARYTKKGTWEPLIAIQDTDHEWIGYDYAWREVDPVNPPPQLV